MAGRGSFLSDYMVPESDTNKPRRRNATEVTWPKREVTNEIHAAARRYMESEDPRGKKAKSRRENRKKSIDGEKRSGNYIVTLWSESDIISTVSSSVHI